MLAEFNTLGFAHVGVEVRRGFKESAEPVAGRNPNGQNKKAASATRFNAGGFRRIGAPYAMKAGRPTFEEHPIDFGCKILNGNVFVCKMQADRAAKQISFRSLRDAQTSRGLLPFLRGHSCGLVVGAFALAPPVSGGFLRNQHATANAHGARRFASFQEIVKRRTGNAVRDAEFRDRIGFEIFHFRILWTCLDTEVLGKTGLPVAAAITIFVAAYFIRDTGLLRRSRTFSGSIATPENRSTDADA